MEGQAGEGLIDLGMEVLEEAQFPEAIANLVKLSPSSSMFQRPYYIHPVTESLSFPGTANWKESADRQPPWSDGRIVLAGDAAHGMPPFMAQGTNQGFEQNVERSPHLNQRF